MEIQFLKPVRAAMQCAISLKPHNLLLPLAVHFSRQTPSVSLMLFRLFLADSMVRRFQFSGVIKLNSHILYRTFSEHFIIPQFDYENSSANQLSGFKMESELK